MEHRDTRGIVAVNYSTISNFLNKLVSRLRFNMHYNKSITGRLLILGVKRTHPLR